MSLSYRGSSNSSLNSTTLPSLESAEKDEGAAIFPSSSGSYPRISIYFLGVLLAISFILWHSKIEENIDPHSLARLKMYCAKEQRVKDEQLINHWKFGKYFQMKNLILTIRHGDRSSIHRMPNSVEDLSHSGFTLLAPEVVQHSKHLDKLQLHPVGHPVHKLGENMSTALDSSLFVEMSDFHLHPGQLTSRGFMQHIHLGQLLRATYQEYFDKLSVNDIYVRSTNYLRTIRSVAAFLISAFPNLTSARSTTSQSIKIAVHTSEENEVMHGIGLRSSSHNQNSAVHGDHEVVGQCQPAVHYARHQKKQFILSPDIENEFVSIFGSEAKQIGATELADASLPSYCHQRPLPCSKSRSEGSSFRSPKCMDEHLLNRVMTEADRYYCFRFMGGYGGRNATNLSIYPFLSEILAHLSPYQSPSHPYKLSIFSGHDTVIAPVLAGLGVYRDQLCRWPQYASRIIFELWEVTDMPSIARDSMTSLAKTYLSASPSASTSVDHSTVKEVLVEKYFVRVIFNGLDVTRMIPTCHVERLQLASDLLHNPTTEKVPEWVQFMLSSSDDFTLCSLQSFTQQIQSMIAPHTSITAACQARS